MKFTWMLLLLLPCTMYGQTKAKLKMKGANTVSASVGQSIERGKVVYAANCLTCHQVDGGGVPNMNPPLERTKWTLGAPQTIIGMILKGSHGTVNIDDETFSNTMPAQKHLTDQQLADVLTYVRKSFGNNASAVMPSTVKALRERIK
jgi:mono/diheme cytochrome c family protein